MYLLKGEKLISKGLIYDILHGKNSEIHIYNCIMQLYIIASCNYIHIAIASLNYISISILFPKTHSMEIAISIKILFYFQQNWISIVFPKN